MRDSGQERDARFVRVVAGGSRVRRLRRYSAVLAACKAVAA